MTQETTALTQETEVVETGVKEVQPPTIEELQAKLKAEQDARSQTEVNWKNAQRLVSKREQELRDIEERLQRIDSQDAMNKALLAIVAERKNQTVEEVESDVRQKQPDYLQEYERIQKANEAAAIQRKVLRYKERTEALIKPDDERYELIEALVTRGKYALADKKLAEIEAEKSNITATAEKEIKNVAEKTEKPKVELDKETRERIFREEMETRGLLKPGITKPSGGGGDKRVFTQEEISDFNFYKENKEAILKAQREGRIK